MINYHVDVIVRHVHTEVKWIKYNQAAGNLDSVDPKVLHRRAEHIRAWSPWTNGRTAGRLDWRQNERGMRNVASNYQLR